MELSGICCHTSYATVHLLDAIYITQGNEKQKKNFSIESLDFANHLEFYADCATANW